MSNNNCSMRTSLRRAFLYSFVVAPHRAAIYVIFSQTMGHLDRYDILVHFQHGFRPNHSCETQLLNTVEDLAHRLDKRKTTDLMILDFSKAFDTVPHRRLLSKMKHYGITGKTNKWIESWLCHRQQRVVLDGTASTDSQVLSGVPQGLGCVIDSRE